MYNAEAYLKFMEKEMFPKGSKLKLLNRADNDQRLDLPEKSHRNHSYKQIRYS